MTPRRRRVAAAVVLVAAVSGTAVGVRAASLAGAAPPTAATSTPAATTARVERGPLSSVVSLDGTLAFRARPDGTPYPATNQARGTYTARPEVGARVGCGDELYRVDDRPVLLVCGTVPQYRDLRVGDAGNDVRQLNATLHLAGADAAVGVDLPPDQAELTSATEQALAHLQAARGLPATGALLLGDAVALPGPVRVAAVAVEPGAPAVPGAPVLSATSDALEVHAALAAWRQGEVEAGARARVELPGHATATGTVDRLGTVAHAPAGTAGEAAPGAASLPVSITLDDPALARGLEQAPVRVEIATDGVDDAFSVPVTAVVGKVGGGYAVEVVHDDGRTELVAVTLGLFDSGAGRVQVDGTVGGALREGDRVMVPAS